MKAGTAALLLGVCACSPAAPTQTAPWTPTRHDYAAFRAGRTEVRDPNYLPFMAHRTERDGRELVFFCRWDEREFPLPVWVEPPRIPDDLQDEFKPTPPQAYVEAVRAALDRWEQRLGAVLGFRAADRSEQARLRIRLVGEAGPLPAPDVQVLGVTPVARGCQVVGENAGENRLLVEFAVPELEIFVADRFGLLPPDQVERLALHELGHALGMRGHSPIPADLMFEVARDRSVDRLSVADVNSFLSLYRIPNGTLYARLPRGVRPERPEAVAPPPPVRLDAEPVEDPRHGYAVRLPEGWLRLPTRQGLVIVDGVAWDYEASLQIIVRRYRSIARYLELHLASHVGAGSVVEQAEEEIAGRPAFRMIVEKGDRGIVEEHSFVESGDGRVVVVIAEAPAALHAGFAPWFAAVLESLELR